MAIVLFGWLPGPVRFVCLVPPMWAVLSLGFRRERLERRFRRERLLPVGPLGDPRSAAWAELSGREAWESAFEWLGRGRRTGAVARRIAYGFALAVLAVSLVAPSLLER